ncbi:hypothetical protein BH10ACI3_BH10ACI3_21140 [soil metagenome]
MKRYIPIFSIAMTAALLLATVVSALVANGSFESGNFTGWTKTVFRNAGFSAAHSSGGVDLTTIVGGAAAAPLSISDAHTSGAVKYPAYGHYSARVNDDTSYTGGGNAKNANTISQNLGAFLDPSDGLAHIRFTYAAVMVNPVSSPHTAEEKPYFRVRAINTSNGNDVLYDFASYVAEPGKNWQNGPVFSGTDTWQYLNWNYIDLSPTPAHPVAAGNIITIEVTAAGCSLGGHPGYVYVDEITDGDIAGPSIKAIGPATIGTGETITYTYSYHNGAGVSINPTVTATQPTGVTFTSTSDPAHCTLSSGKYTCNFTGVPASGDGTFTISGTVTAALGAQIAHGGYDIAAAGYPTVGGQTVLTDVNTAGTVTTITSDAPDPSLPGQSVTVIYTVTSTSGTPAGTVTITDSASAATCNSTVAVGTCNLTLPNTGPHTLTATYGGNATYNPSSDTESHTVALPNTTVTSINRNNPTPTNASSVAWTVTFANAVSGLTSSNLALANGGLGGTPAITNVAAVGAQPTATWTVTASTGSGDGTLGLNMANNTGMSHNVTNVPFTGQVYTFDRTPPDTVITTQPTNPTASSTANFTFTGGGTYECSLDGAPFTVCTGPKNYTGLSDGSHTFDVRAIDAVGNVDPTPATYTWVVDATPPDTTILTSPSNPTNSANAAFTFTGNDGTGTGVFSYECSLDGAPFAACTTPANFNGLSDGSHTFNVRAIDVVGNVDPTPASYTWVVDATPPDTTILTNPSNPTNSASANFTFIGNDGTGTGVFSYECSLDGAPFAACTTPKSFSSLSDGSHTFNVRAIDVVNNVDPTPASYTWVVDTTPPDTTILTHPSNPTNSASANFTFTGNDGTGTGVFSYECSLDGAPFAACTTPVNFSSLSDGSHTFSVRAIDVVNNVDPTPASYTWIVDATPPDTVIDTHPANPTNSANAAFTFTGNDGTGTGVFSFECSLDGAPFAACSTPLNLSGLADGSHTFNVRAIDVVGNVDLTPASFTWVVDTTPPDTTIVTHPTVLTNSAGAAFTFTGDDGTGTGVFSYECRVDAAAFAACTTPLNLTGLSDGSHTFDVRAIDVVGNVDPTPASYTWTVDTTRPTVTINQAASQADPTTTSPIGFHVVFSESIGTSLSSGEVSVSGTAGAATAVLTEAAPLDGTTFDVAVSGMANPGTVIANIAANMAQDAAGNGNTASTSTDNTVNFTVDTVTTITSNMPDPSSIGQSVIVNYTVTAPLGTPAGNVVVTDSQGPASCTATIAAGTCDIVLTAGGVHTLTATYAGGGGYNGSSDTSAQTVYEPASIQFSSPDYTDDEYQTASIDITRTGDPTGTLSVSFQTLNGNATGGAACTAGVDYVSVSGLTVTFNPNEMTKSVGVLLCPDNLTEPDQTVILALSGANVGPPATAVLLINDTATRFRNEVPILIDGGGTSNPYPSQITVAGGPSIVGGMRITLYDLQAMSPDTIYVMLMSPRGQKFVLMGGAGGTADLPGPVTLNFTDTAGRVMPDTAPLTTNDFEPTTWGIVKPFPLAPAGPTNLPGSTIGGGGTQTLIGNFGGTNSNGVWTLFVIDDSAMSVPVGKFAGGWGLEFYAPTAASASVSGRVLTTDGAGIKGAKVTITGNSLMEPLAVTTGSFGYYSIDGLTVGETYVITVASKRFTFQAPSRVISLVDSVADADFIASGQ